MFIINDDASVYVTRGDIVSFDVEATRDGAAYTFQAGDVLRLKVFSKKDCKCVALTKDFEVVGSSPTVTINLTGQETKIGGIISKPVDYWYEVELNPDTFPQTIIGYDEDAAKVFRLFPEGREMNGEDLEEEDIPWVDAELSGTSTHPVQNRAVTAEIYRLREAIQNIPGGTTEDKPAAVSVDFSTYDSGTFTETLADGSKVTYTVTFDESGNPININNGESDFAIVWG